MSAFRPIDRLRLAIVSEDFTDAEVKRLFLDCEVESIDDIETVVGSLQQHRPDVVKELAEHTRLTESYHRIKKRTEL